MYNIVSFSLFIDDGESKFKISVRHITIARQEVINTFLKNHFASANKCSECNQIRTRLYAEDHTHLYYKVRKSRKKTNGKHKITEMSSEDLSKNEERQSSVRDSIYIDPNNAQQYMRKYIENTCVCFLMEPLDSGNISSIHHINFDM